MMTADALNVLSLLLDLGERQTAKKAARRVLEIADVSELWTIARAAAILDGHRPNIARAKLANFAESLTDDRRRALVAFISEHTGDRPRIPADTTRVPFAPLSVFHDTRPGYDEHDAQPTGLTVHPAPWEAQRAQRLAQLASQLRNHTEQLPERVRMEIRKVTTCTNASVRRAPKTNAQQRADRITDDYARTGLNVDDKTMPTMRTVFDIDDDAPADSERPDGYTLDYDRAARTALRATPCISCFVERRPQDDRTSGHDDGLCEECRTANRPGLLPRPSRRHRAPRTVAYLNPQARAAAANANAITARCAAVADHLPPAAALVWIRAYYRLAPEAHRHVIAAWVTEWQNSHQPQPPTPITPAAPAPALAAA